MSVNRYFNLTCDKDDCIAMPCGRFASTPEEARADAKKEGWVTKQVGESVFDYCPRHAGEEPSDA